MIFQERNISTIKIEAKQSLSVTTVNGSKTKKSCFANEALI